MKAHAILSPSGAHRWLACPGSVAANANKPWEQSVYALEGTTAHALLEVCLRLDVDPEAYVGKVLQKGHMAITEDMVDAVGYGIDYVKAYLVDNPLAIVRIESPVYPAALLGVGDEVIWGTPDIRILNFPKEHVTIDYKHGAGKSVAVKNNDQIRIYHAGGRVEGGVYRKYRSVVIQPRLRGRKPVQEATLTDKELMQWLDGTVKPIIPIALSDDAPRNPGAWCHFCHADGRCDAQLKKAFEMAKQEFGKVVRNPKDVTPAQLAIYLDDLPMVETAIKALKEHATRVLHAGVKVPGYAPGWTTARREWVDEEKLVAALKRKKVDLKDIYEVVVRSPAKMEDLLKEKGVIPRKKRGEAPPPTILDDHIGYKEQNKTYTKVG